MNPETRIGRWSIGVLFLAALTVQAQTYFYKTNNNDTLDLGTSWTNGAAPSSASTDIAVWDAQVSTAANCSNSIPSAATPAWAGIQILNPVAPVKITSSANLSLGASGIDLNEAATSQDLWLAMSVITANDQNWTVKNGRTLTIGDTSRNVNIQNVITPSGHISYVNNLQIQSGGILNIGPGATIDPSSAVVSGATINIGSSGSGTVNQSGGSFTVKRSSGTSGSPAASLSIASAGSSSATYTITGGSLIDSSPADTAWIAVGGGSSSTGTLNVDGTANLQLIKVVLGNAAGATGTINLSNGTVRVVSTTFDVGRSSGTANGFVNVYGGTLYFAGNMNLGRGPGSGTLNIFNGNTYLSGVNVSGANSGAGPGTTTVSGGNLTITNSLTLAANTSVGNAIVNLNGGTTTVGSVGRGTGTGATVQFNFNGGTLKAFGPGGTIIPASLPTFVQAGGAIFDSAGFNITCAAPLLDGTGGGGLTKQGLGRLTLSGTNTYTGSTLVTGGSLYLTTTIHPGGPITVNDSTLLRTTLAANGTTLPCSSLTLGTTAGATAEFDLSGNPNAAVPLVYATNLTAKGVTSVNVFGTALAQGTIPLIQYNGSVSGGGTFSLSFVQGWSGYVTNNTAAKQVQLVITSAKSLVWRALSNTNWDLATANWFDLSNSVPTAFTGGATTYFDDSTSNSLVYLTGSMAPGAMAINNSLSNYTFQGVGQISGVGGLTKIGSGTVTMSVSNAYSGSTIISNGVFKLGTNGAIPATGVVLEGRLEMNGFSDNIGSLNGSNGVVNNASPPSVLGVTSGTFAGQLTNSGGSLTLSKTGGGTLTLLSKNTYSGGTTNGGGTMVLAFEQSIGTGPFTINGATLAWLDAASHTLTNPVVLAGNATFGVSPNGPLTIANTADFAAGGRTINCSSNVSFPNGFVNGWFAGKGGTGDLLLRNATSHNPTVGGTGTITFGSGNTILDNIILSEENGNVRLRAGNDNETCRVAITNGSSFLMTNTSSQNFRYNDGGSANNTINILDLSGNLTILPYAGSNSKLQMGSSSDLSGQNILNLLPGGVLRVKQILDQGPNSSSVFNFNGGTLSPNSDELATTFMQFLDSCSVLDGGAIIDTAGFNITIGQALSAGGTSIGGLTKQGLGTLYLTGGGSYGGPTLVSAGGLSGNSSISSPVTVASGATIGAGTPTAIGSFGLNGSLTLSNGSFAAMRINSDSLTSDTINQITTLTYAGTLVVTNIGTTTLAQGNTFSLFTLASGGSYHGGFSAYSLPSLPFGLAWDTSKLTVDGSIQVVAGTVPPSFTSTILTHDGLVMSGTGGPAGHVYYIVTSTNVTAPAATWTTNATSAFLGDGSFKITNAVNTAETKRFFRVKYSLP